MRSTGLWCLLAAVVGCYSAPRTSTSAEVLELTADQTTAPANGANVVNLTVKIAEDTTVGTTIHLEASSGILNFAAEPTSEAARELDLKFPGAGDVRAPLRVGRNAGPLLVVASAGDVTEHLSITLEEAEVEGLALSVDRGRVRADGVTPITVSAQLTAVGDGAQVSLGTRVNFAVCCKDPTAGTPTPCNEPALLTLAPFATTDEDGTATARAIPSVAPDAGGEGGGGSEGPATIAYFIVASTEDATCSPPSGLTGATLVQVLLEP